MYKIITDITQITAINQAVAIKESNPDSRYCDVVKHPIKEEYIIPIIENLLRSYEVDFITDEWLSTNLIEEIPTDWTWLYDTQKRIIIPNYLILSNPYLTALIEYCNQNNVLNFIDKDSTWVYVNYIIIQHSELFDMINNETGVELIKIEEK